MAGRLEFELRFAGAEARPRRRAEPDDPFRILVIGEFSGADRRDDDGDPVPGAPIRVDVDNFDRVLDRLAPRTVLRGGGLGDAGVEVAFQELDDFHPERLIDNMPVFAELRRLRRRLTDPATFEQAAAELARDPAVPPPSSPPGATPATTGDDGGGTFERLLGGRPDVSPGRGAASSPAQEAADRLIARIVGPHVVRGADPDRQRMLVAAVDDGISGLVRSVLHDPGFQALEAAWRGLRSLVFGLETGEDLQIFVLDAGRAALTLDLAAAGEDLEGSSLHRTLVDGGGAPWSLVVGDIAFGPGEADMALLAALGTIAARAGAAFLGGAAPALLGCETAAGLPEAARSEVDDETAARWRAMRAVPAASRIGLALPRLLMRLPYGARTDPVSGFDFEEVTGAGGHDALLWGNPAFGCALTIGRAFQVAGWRMAPDDVPDIDDLPAYVAVEDGEQTLKPCAEVLLSQRVAEAILDRGIMPVMSHANRNAVRLPAIRSIADPPAALAGPWG